MGDITLAGANDAVDGETTSADKFNRNLFNPAAPAKSFAELNGGIDKNNFVSKTPLTRETIHPGQLMRGGMRGGTANRDYFSDLFFLPPDTDISEGTEPDNYVPIANAGMTFHLPYAPTGVMVTWMIELANNARKAVSGGTGGSPTTWDESSLVKLFVDGVAVDATRRSLHACIDLNISGGGTAREARVRARQRDRRYSGHHWLTGLTAGWHTVGLQIVSNARHTRVRTSNIKHLVWR